MKKRGFSLLLAVALLLSATLMGVFTFSASAATSGYYTYEVTDGEATITAVDTAISGDVTIPDTLGSYPVTSIGSGRSTTAPG